MNRSTIRKRQMGFTLAELCAAMAVSGALAAVGMPTMASFNGKAVVSAQSEGLMSALRLARNEAVSRGEQVSVCAMDPASAESGAPKCLARGKNWSAGWIVFIDRDDRGDMDDADRVVFVQQAPARAGVVGTGRFVTYRPTGVLLSAMAHFRVLGPGQPLLDQDMPGASLICLNKTGRPRIASKPHCD
ncbi:GspH/FimT family pseudopilin [Ideonella sp.]|uniref:GspH/FimT family pseudopilin n=1 Tax=Ideonella sp. TaxID=1929293 RepID=UPI0035B208AB